MIGNEEPRKLNSIASFAAMIKNMHFGGKHFDVHEHAFTSVKACEDLREQEISRNLVNSVDFNHNDAVWSPRQIVGVPPHPFRFWRHIPFIGIEPAN
jgi:hypothetical protein